MAQKHPSPVFTEHIGFLEELTLICGTTCSHFHKSRLTPLSYYVVNMIKRVKDRSASLIPLLENFTVEEHSVDYGIGLILRNQATDMLHILHFFDLQMRGQTATLNNRINDILEDGQEKAIEYFEILRDHFPRKYKQDRIESLLLKLKETTPRKKKTSISSKYLFKQLVTTQTGNLEDDDYKKDLAQQAYDTFMMYSKLEHFSKASEIVSNLPISNRIKSIKIKIQYSVFLADTLHKMLFANHSTDFGVKQQIAVNKLLKKAVGLDE
jgi:hypothetical protein